jgi:hypothetical protein
MDNKTAVEYLVEQLFPKALSVEQHYHIEKAKEIAKEQAIRLHYEYELYVMMNESIVMTFGQFYKQTYGGGEQ